MICLGSCSDFLDRENEDKVLVENYWDTVEDCEYALNAVYNAFKAAECYQFVDQNLRTDLGISGGSNRSGTSDAMMHTFNDSYSNMTNQWMALYRGAFRANQVIEGVATTRTKLDMSITSYETSLNKIEAQAYFFRGLFYFWLNNLFNYGEVPILDYVPVNMPDDLYQPVSSSEEVKNFYRADMIKALELGLPDTWADNSDLGRATTGAVYSIMGMSYLYDEDYATARYYFNLVTDYLDYTLLEDNNQWTTANEFSCESILEINYNLDYNTQYSGEYILYNNFGMLVSQVSGWYSLIPALWLVDEYMNEDVDPLNPENWEEVEFDNTYIDGDNPADIYYKHFGERVGSTSSSGETYLVYKYSSLSVDPDNGSSTRLCMDYGTRVYKKEITYASGSDPVEITYTDYSGKDYLDNYLVHYHDGEWIHRRIYSRRASNSFAINGDTYLKYYTQSVQEAAGFSDGRTGYFRKYSNWDIWEEETDGSPTNASAINFRVIRLADIYLLYAEALLEGGTTDAYKSDALKYINRVRERAGVVLMGEAAMGEFADGVEHSYDGVSYTAQELMEHLMYKERPMEVCLDGNSTRQIDLRRWGVTKERLTDLATWQYGLYGTGIPYISVDKDDPTSYSNNTKFAVQKPYPDWFDENGKTTTTIYTDFGQASLNYNDTKAYWPIPSVEKNANPYIN